MAPGWSRSSTDSVIPRAIAVANLLLSGRLRASGFRLATRIPKSLHRQLKLHCVHADMSVMEFVVAALKEKLGRKPKKGTA